jgi:DNA-binding SARP family transcriptional activator
MEDCMKLEIRLFGIPQIILDGKKMEWSLKKAEALVIYLYMMKSASKITIADMFWGDLFNQEKSMQNCRNCLYLVRKSLGKDIFNKQSGGIISLNEDYDITSDYDDVISGKITLGDMTDTEFMKSYYLKESSIFNEWLDDKRNEIKTLLIEKSMCIIDEAMENENLYLAERNALKMLEIDEFEERTYKYLMEIYDIKGQFNKITTLYNSLEKLFRKELAIAPSKDIKDIVEKARSNRNKYWKNTDEGKASNGSAVKTGLYGRKKEMNVIYNEIKSFSNGSDSRSIVVSGEEGIGKTSLVNASIVIIPDNVKIYRTQCYRAERGFILKPWYYIIRSISKDFESIIESLPLNMVTPLISVFPSLRTDKIMNDMEVDNIIYSNYEVIEREVVNLLLKIIENNKILVVFEDIQWIDDVSLSLIRNMLAMDKNSSLLFLMTSRIPGTEKVDVLTYDMIRSNQLQKIELERFTKEETIEAVDFITPDIKLNEEEVDKFYFETEGNPFYIKEILGNFMEKGVFIGITSNIKNLLHQRITILEDEEKKILEIISIHFDGVRLDFLITISLLDEIKLINIIEKLMDKKLIYERLENEDIVYCFTHMKIQEYVYMEMSHAKKKILHGKSASIFENMLTGNIDESFFYSKIIYHYEKAGNINKFIEYTIKYLYNHLCVAHEFFPVYEKKYDSKVKMKSDNLEHHFTRISKWVESIDTNIIDMETQNHISMFYHMIGRYHIRAGEYDKGMVYIEKLKMLNSIGFENINSQNIIKANRQLVCIFMNRCDEYNLGRIIEETIELTKNESEEERAIWYRLEGYHRIMTGDIVKARECLCYSIKVFESSSKINKYIVNLVASYNWLGETYRLEEEYEIAIKYYSKAISLCEDSDMLGGTPIFYANYGQCLYEMGEIEKSMDVIEKSIDLYKLTDSLWGKSLPYSYRSMICFDKMEYDKSRQDIIKCIEYSDKLDSSYESGICLDSRNYIKNKLEVMKDINSEGLERLVSLIQLTT